MRARERFIRSDKPVAEVAREMGAILGVALSPVSSSFEFNSVRFDLRLARHSFVDDGDLTVESYPFVLIIWARDDLDDLSEEFFTKVTAAGFPAMLVDDMEVLLRKRDPTASAAPGALAQSPR